MASRNAAQQKTFMKYKIAFLGAGRMAEGILTAVEDVSLVIMAEKVAARAEELRQRYGVVVTDDLKAAAKSARIVFLAVRPQDVDDVAEVVRPVLKPTQVLVSIVAGKTISKLRRAFGPDVRIVRVMPNLALRAKAGMCAICAAPNAKRGDVAAVERILGKAGRTVVLDERHFDAVTALSGSGPAYFAYMAKAMADAGMKLGLDGDVALELSEQTMYGTAKFLLDGGVPLDQFIAGVCTKGGTTAAGMDVLAQSDFTTAVADTLAAAAKRSKELA